jgi:hypothetical protein
MSSEDYRFDLIRDAVTDADADDEPQTRHSTTCELLMGIQRRVCTCPLHQSVQDMYRRSADE